MVHSVKPKTKLIILLLVILVPVGVALSYILKTMLIPSSDGVPPVEPPADALYRVGVYNSTHYFAEHMVKNESLWTGLEVNDMFSYCFDNLPDGGTIFVTAGTYYGYFELISTNYITILGEDREETVFYMPNDTQRNNILLWQSDYVTLRYFKVYGNRANNPYGGRIDLQNGVWIEGCDNLVIDEITVENTPRQGLELNTRSELGGGHYVEIKNSLFIDCGWNGLTIVIKAPGEAIIVDNCTATGCTDLGFSVYEGAGVVIKNSRAYSNWGMERGNPTHSGFGVENDRYSYVEPGAGPTFINCEAWDNLAGNYALHYSDTIATYINCSFHDNEWGVRWASYAAGPVVLDDCNITNNLYADIFVATPVALFELRNSEVNTFYLTDATRECKIFNNNIFNPDIRISDATIEWDNGFPSGGNYWGDYTGMDKYSGPNQDQPTGDGIGDSPYIIDETNRDNFPVIAPFN
jgi:hypothetical protein